VVTEIAVTGTGVVQPSVDYLDVGIELNVTPIINFDGYVTMHVEPTIATTAESGQSIGGGIELPTFIKREASTDVTVKDGETVIIGGLIRDETRELDAKAPILGDVPVLGALFRNTSRTKVKTELLIVLTPHVVRVADDAVEMSRELRDMTGLNDNIRHSPLMEGLRVQPEEEFGPDVLPNGSAPTPRPRTDDEPTIDKGEQLGPVLEEYGPSANMIRIGGVEPAVAVRPDAD
jgi:type II secretory pathway component GspD/PulD (secretin)